MGAYADNKKGNKSLSATNISSQKSSKGTSVFQFVDNRPEAIAQRRLREKANNYATNQQPVQRKIKPVNDSSHDPLPAKFTNAIANFINVVQANDSLKFLSKLPEHKVLMNIIVLDNIGTAEGYTDIKIKGSGKIKTKFKSTGSDLGELRALLRRGTPKFIKIEIQISYDVLNSESEPYIASVLAHEVGTHLAPYARVIEKVANQKKLSGGETRVIETAHGTDHEQVDHRALHNGYLKANWSPFYQKPMYRELVDALAKTHYTTPGDFQAIWKAYVDDVARYDTERGKPHAKNKSAQLAFYQEYESYRQGKKRYPVLKKLAANKGLSVAVIIGILLIMFLMFQVGNMVLASRNTGLPK